MTFVPDGTIALCSVPITDYKNQIDFGTDDTARYNYFWGKRVTTFTDYNYVRRSQKIRVKASRDSLYNCNYLMFQNTNFTNKWFYAFITGMEWINANMTLISYEIDVWQTWESSLVFENSYIKRAHVSDDSIGANTQAEGFLNYQYIREREHEDIITQTDLLLEPNYCIAVYTLGYFDGDTYKNVNTSVSSTIPGTGNSNSFIVTGCVTLFGGLGGGNVSLNEFLQKYATSEKSSELISVYYLPYQMFDYFAEGTITFNTGNPIGRKELIGDDLGLIYTTPILTYDRMTQFNISKDETSYWTPANNKLFTFPYTKIVVSNMEGTSITLKQEYCGYTENENYKNKLCFALYFNPFPTASITAEPLYYGENSKLNMISSGAAPVTNFQKDSFQIYFSLNQNTLRYKQEIAERNKNLNLAGGVINQLGVLGGIGQTAVGGIENASANTISGDIKAANTGMSGIPNAISGSYNTYKMLRTAGDEQDALNASLADAMLVPNESSANTVTGVTNILQSTYGIYYCIQRYPYEYLKIIDDYFSHYGYAVNEFNVPNYTNRPNWNYIETINCNVRGNVPQEDLNLIKQIFDSGITMWHNNGNGFLNYNRSNK